MPKLKTKSGAKKRFKVTASGKVSRAQAGNSRLYFENGGTIFTGLWLPSIGVEIHVENLWSLICRAHVSLLSLASLCVLVACCCYHHMHDDHEVRDSY
jgi:hypothetical protein